MNLIEHLNDLCTEYEGGALALSVVTDLRAIIEQAKAEKQEPFCYLCDWGDHNGLQRVAVYYGEPGSAIADDWNEFPKVHQNLPLYRTPQPDIVAELVKALGDDAYAASFQSMAGYRTALIAKVKGWLDE